MIRALAHVRANAFGYVALFLALTGSAYAAAVAPRNSAVSSSIKNGQVKSADLRTNGVRGVDVNEGSLDKVPHAARADQAPEADLLGGLPPASYQRRVTGSCAGGSGLTAIGDGFTSCNSPVSAIDLTRLRGGETDTGIGNSSLRIDGVCGTAGNPSGPRFVRFFNGSSGTATLNWIFSAGGATSTVEASGVALAAGGTKSFTYSGARIEGKFVFADADGITTVNLHAFDDIAVCEVLGTAQFAATP